MSSFRGPSPHLVPTTQSESVVKAFVTRGASTPILYPSVEGMNSFPQVSGVRSSGCHVVKAFVPGHVVIVLNGVDNIFFWREMRRNIDLRVRRANN